MDAYQQQDTAGFAFQKPFHPQGNGPLRPFTAVDLAPQAKSGTAGPLGPTVSPFLESFAGPAEDGDDSSMPVTASRAAPEMPAPLAAPLAPLLAPPLALPHPAPLPAAAHPSRIMAASELPASTGSALKPRFFVTSTAVVDGHPIQAYLDVISAEIVLPKDLLFRNPAPYGELHRLKDAEDKLQKVKALAMEELTEKAKGLSADGIVGVTVTFTNLDTVCCLCSAVGTAVRIA